MIEHLIRQMLMRMYRFTARPSGTVTLAESIGAARTGWLTDYRLMNVLSTHKKTGPHKADLKQSIIF